MNDDTRDVSLIAPSLEQVRQRFESWRQRRKKRTRIPQNLWKAAAALSETYSISQLSKALRVNHTTLKNQVAKFATLESSLSDGSAFVELPGLAESFLESSIEMIKSDGSVMRMHVKGAGCLDVVELGRAFLAMDS